jgi:hypothetical protein
MEAEGVPFGFSHAHSVPRSVWDRTAATLRVADEVQTL